MVDWTLRDKQNALLFNVVLSVVTIVPTNAEMMRLRQQERAAMPGVET